MRRVFFVVLFLWGSAAGAVEVDCPTTVCYDIHGRLRIYANMRPYLLPADSNKRIAVADFLMPENVRKLLALDRDIVGDFRVCPMTKNHQGIMNTVCIESATHLIGTVH